jgi:hypothetical protein
VSSVLNGNVSYGASAVTLVNANNFSSSGFAYLDDALISWTSKPVPNVLGGVTWHSGNGTYAFGSQVTQAHESLLVQNVTPSLGVILFRITHANSAGEVSAPAYLWYFVPPTPVSSRHCVVITNVATDLGIEPRQGIGVQAFLSIDRSFGRSGGQHLDAAQSLNKTQTTNAFGLTFHQCVKDNARADIDGGVAPYTFVLDSGTAQSLTVHANIPDQNWVLLSQLVTE